MSKKLPVLFSLLVVFALLVSACSPGAEGTETVPGDTAVVTDSLEPLEATATPLAESAATATVDGGNTIDQTATPLAGADTGTPPAQPSAQGRDMNLISNILGERVIVQNLDVDTTPDNDMTDDSGDAVTTTDTPDDGAVDDTVDTTGDMAESESIGTIDSIIVDSASGQIAYVLLAPEAILEVDNDYVALPWSLLQINASDNLDVDVSTDDTDSSAADAADNSDINDDVAIVYTGDIARLQDPAVWVAEAQFDQGMQLAADIDSSLRTAWGADVAALPQTGTDTETAGLIRLNDVEDRNLVNADGEDIGDIEDMILDPKQGLINYVVVASGGLLDIGEELIPVPFEMLSFQPNDAGGNDLMLMVNQTDLEAAPRFPGTDEIPDTRVDDWELDFQSFWQGIQPNTDTDAMETPAATTAP